MEPPLRGGRAGKFGVLSGATPEQCDLDGDGDVALQNLTILLANFGTKCP